MKNITLSADEDLIERARWIARAQQKTLNAVFREWLAQFTASSGDTQSFDAVMTRMRHVDTGHHYGRDEMNGRFIVVTNR
jgi:predicted transcriptional regulator